MTQRITLIKRIINSDSKHTFHFDGYLTHKGLYLFTDQYRIYALKENFGYDKSIIDGQVNIENLISKNLKEGIEIKIDIKNLREFIKENKDYKNKSYLCAKGDFSIWFNPRYLLDLLQMFNTDTIFCENPYKPCYVGNDSGEWGLLFPVKL